MSRKLKTSRLPRNAAVIVTGIWLIASYAAAQLPLPPRNPLPPRVPAVAMTPPEITGGGSVKAFVTLSAPGTTAMTVTLSSSLPAVASVPASIVVPAGASSFTYTVTTVPVATDTAVQITARVAMAVVPGGATIRVLAPVLVSVVLDRLSVPGGVQITKEVLPTSWPPVAQYVQVQSGGVVSISGPAASDLSIAFASSDRAAAVPASLVIAAHTTSVHFPITTATVSASTIAEISAQLGTTTKSASLEIVPRLIGVTVSPASVAGGQSLNGTVSLSGPAPNGGNAVKIHVNRTTYLGGSGPCYPALLDDLAAPHVMIPAGSTSAPFVMVTSGLASMSESETYAISAVSDGVTQSGGTLTVVPTTPNPSVEAPTRIKGGTTAMAKIKLDHLPISENCGQYVFWIGVTGTAARTEGRLVFPAHALEAWFSIITTAVDTEQSITLSVTGSVVSAASLYAPIPVNLPIKIVQPQPMTIVVAP